MRFRLHIYGFVCAIVLGNMSAAFAQEIRLRTANRETEVLIGSMLEKLSESHGDLVGKVDVEAWRPGFVRFAEGDCDILIENRWPKSSEMKKLSWGIGSG